YGPGFEIVKQLHPRSPYQAKFSIAYCVAAALSEGRVSLDQFSAERFGPDGVLDRAIAGLLARTSVTVAGDLTAKYPAAWPARLALTMDDGTARNGAADFPRGNPENPVTTAELEQKFLSLVEPRLGGLKARAALAAVHNLESARDMAGIFRDL